MNTVSDPHHAVPDASAQEAAAITAALEQFMRDRALPGAAPAPRTLGAWRQAALREAVRRAPDVQPPWL
ncbi:MAG: hypothetical protein ACP5H2_10435 [Solirubrobacteraceae bacterium]